MSSLSLQEVSAVPGASRISTADRRFDNMGFDAGHGEHFVVVPIADVDKPAMNAIRYAKLLGGEIIAVHVLLDPFDRDGIEYRWTMQNTDIPLIIIESPNSSLIRPIAAFVDRIRGSHKESVVTIVLPVLIGLRWWQRILHNQTARLIERAFQSRAGVVTIRVPFSLALPV